MKKAFKISFALASITVLVSCNLEANPDSTALMTAINYEAPSRIVYSRDDTYNTPNGRPINKGDYKPVFSALQDRLGINMLEHQAAANSGDKKSVAYFRDNWMTKRYADMSMGTVYDINNYSTAGSEETILDLKPYIEETKFIKGPDPHHDPKDPDPAPIVDIVDPEHPGSLPNIALFLHKNPGVMMSIVTAKHSYPEKGAIYYVPYFDGFNDLEKGTVLRADYTKRLLDDDPESTAHPFSDVKTILGSTGATYTQHFEPCYVVSDGYAPQYTVVVPNVYEEDVKDPDGKIIHYEGDPKDENNPTMEIEKKPGVPNIIKLQNNLIKDNNATSQELAEQFRDYINRRYGKPKEEGGDGPFDHYSDLFLAYKACYDTDELVALMRLVKVSSGTLFGKDDDGKWIDKEMITMMPRLCDNQRASDIYRWAGQTFGVRGLESRNGYLYINGIKDYSDVGYGKYGAVHDARGSDDMLYVLKKLRNLYEEGLILQNFDDMTATGSPNGKFADETLYSGGNDHYASFMLYDYPNDMNDWNKYRTSEKKEECDWITHGDVEYPYDLRAVVGAVAKWDVDGDGKHDNDEYIQFTESLSSVKTSALCLNADLPKNEEKLKAAFNLIDFIYSDEGMFLYNFGPYEDGYITEKAGDYTDGKLGVYSEDAEEDVDYIEYQGERYPCLTEEAKKQHDEISGLQRERVGATIPFGFNKLKVVPYQTYHPNTKHGADILNKAFELGTMKHVLVGGYTEQQQQDYEIPFYQICPSTFFLTKGQSSAISSLLDKNTLGSMFTDSSTSNFNIWDSLIMGKETRLGVTLDNYLDTIRNSWKVGKLESYYQDAFEIMTKPMEDPVR